MKFTIITPTYKRPDNLLSAIQSVMDQSYTNWHMIIVNDSPSDQSYGKIEEKVKNDPQITYIKNDANRGVNFSRNRALDIAVPSATNDDWIIFLDDDDTLAKDSLKRLSKVHEDHPQEKWIVTNRASYEGVSFTKAPHTDTRYSYIFEYLLTRKIRGDATHCIHAKEIKDIRFSKRVKQAEEWLFYYELALSIKKFFYHDHNSTLSFGYHLEGLNFRKRSRKEKFLTLCSLVRESYERNIIVHPTLLSYFLARTILLI